MSRASAYLYYLVLRALWAVTVSVAGGLIMFLIFAFWYWSWAADISSQFEALGKTLLVFSAPLAAALIIAEVFFDFFHRDQKIDWKVFDAHIAALGWREWRKPSTVRKVMRQVRPTHSDS